MATNVQAILANLLTFYDFSSKDVIAVGAGGGQLAGYGALARSVVAIDPDTAALAALAKRAEALALTSRFTYCAEEFEDTNCTGDVALFEFSLHEMKDPARALTHASSVAREVVVLDHAPGSPWAFHTDEVEKVTSSWQVIDRRGLRRMCKFDAAQTFADHEELVAKVACQGEEALKRAERFRGQRDVRVPMPYVIALL